MPASLKKLASEYGFGGAVMVAVALYVIYMTYKYLQRKGYVSEGYEPKPVEASGTSDYEQLNAPSQSISGCQGQQQTSADLMPLPDPNSNWGDLNPAGQGDLESVSLLKAGYHIGIDTVGQSLRNANQQIRSEPPNPQANTGPWNQSTIEPDFMRPALEIGSGGM
jgi:hypothetical protein